MDIVDRLRTVFEDAEEVASWQDNSYNGKETVDSLMGMHAALHEAADEIERLREEIASCTADIGREVSEGNRYMLEAAELREQLAACQKERDELERALEAVS